MKATLVLLVVFVFSSTAGSPISFCEDVHKIYLNLSHAGITKLEQSFVGGVSIKCLNLANNELSKILPEAFAAGLPDLEDLELSGNRIMFDDFTRLRVFENLKTLILDRALYNEEWRYRQNYPLLRYYSPSETEEFADLPISNYGEQQENPIDFGHSYENNDNDNPLMFFPKLEQLSMSDYFNSLPHHVLHWLSLPSLTHLCLNNNKVESVRNLPESLLKHLTHLYVNNNELSAFSGFGLGRLRHLSLNQNKIQRLCVMYCNQNAMLLRTMPSLENLSIVGNSISMIDPYAFANLANLVTVDLSENKIDNVVHHAFANMTKLENLKLDDNLLSRIPNICAVVNLRTLSLAGNRITSINETSFCNLPKLTYVNLRHNHLTNVAKGTFDYLPAIATIDLSWNNIVSLPTDWMRPDIHLEVLHLDANFFNDVASMSLDKINNLGSLSIGRNPFKTVTIASLIGLPINTTVDFTYTDDHKDGASQQT